MRGKYLVIALLLLSQNAQALQCSSLFQEQVNVPSSAQKDFWYNAQKRVSDSKLVDTFTKIRTWIKEGKEISFDQRLEEIPAQDRLATMLYALSFSKTGRNVISKNLQTLEKYYDQKMEDIRMPVKVEACAMKCVAYFELMEESVSSKLKLNKKLKLGSAIAVLGHELTHVYDFMVRDISAKISDNNKRHLFTEYNAYFNEKRIIRELLENPKFKKYIESVKDDALNSLFTQNFTSKEFIRIMKDTDKVPEEKTKAFLEKTQNPNFEI